MKQETLAISGLVGFSWIDAFMEWPVIIRLPMTFGLSLVVVVVPFFSGANLEMTMTSLFLIVISGSLLAILVILARGAEEDLADREQCSQLRLSRSQSLKESGFAVLWGFSVVSVYSFIFEGSLLDWLFVFVPGTYLETDGAVMMAAWVSIVMTFLMGVIGFHLVRFMFRQSDVFVEAVAAEPKDLLHAERYETYTIQPMRYFLILVIFASLSILTYLVFSRVAPDDEEIVATLLLGNMVFMCLLAVLVVRPVVAVRDKIQQEKQLELKLIQQALAGERAVLKNSQIAHIADEFSAPDLMAYEERINKIWEWPVQGFVQRIVLYVLLPPLAWVLAALVERMLDAFL